MTSRNSQVRSLHQEVCGSTVLGSRSMQVFMAFTLSVIRLSGGAGQLTVRAALAAFVILAFAGASSCTTKPHGTRSKLNDRAIGAPALLRFETVRSMLEDSKGNYWFGSWKEGVARFDGKMLTYFTVDDGLSDNQIRSIYEDRNGSCLVRGRLWDQRF